MNTINKNSFYNVKIIDKKINITTTINGGLTNPPDPDIDAADVISLFGDTYDPVPNINYPNWGQSTTVVVDDFLHYNNLNYQGMNFASNPIDLTDGGSSTPFTHLHIDFFTIDSTKLNFSLRDGGDVYQYHTLVPDDNFVQGQWVSVDIPLSVYTVPNLSKIIHAVVEGNGSVKFDNIYFYKQTTEPEPDLFFSEYGEGSSNNKYFEIFNPTSELKKLDDYAILYHGGSRLWYNFTLNETLTNGSVYIVCTNQSDDSIKIHANVELAYPSIAHFNGDDTLQIVKKKSGSDNFSASGVEGIDFEVIDSIGDRIDPGSGWAVAGTSTATKDHTLVRKSNVTTGNSDWDASRGTTVENSEWIVYPKNTWSYLGSHTMSTGSTTVQIPDEHFRQYLIDTISDISTSSFNGNNEIDVSLVNTITSISLINKPITDLTGIEAFTALSNIYISDVPITGDLDLSNNSNLINFSFYNYYWKGYDGLSNLNLSNGNANLIVYLYYNHNIQTLSLSNTLNSLNIYYQPSLFAISSMQSVLDNLSSSTITYNFYISAGVLNLDFLNNSLGLNRLSLSQNDTIQSLNLSLFTNLNYLYLYNCSNLSDLILHNDAINTLTSLNIYYTPLQNFKYNSYTNLTRLDLNNQDLSSIGLPNLPKLYYLKCTSCNLQSADLSIYPNLENCTLTYNNGITSLDISNNPNLTYLYINHTNINELDITNNSKFYSGYFPVDTTNAPGEDATFRIISNNNPSSNIDGKYGTYDTNGVYTLSGSSTGWDYMHEIPGISSYCYFISANINDPPVFTTTVSGYSLAPDGVVQINLADLCIDYENDPITFSVSNSDDSIVSINHDESTNILNIVSISFGKVDITVNATSSNLTTTKILQVSVGPAINLLGDSVVNMEVGSTYIDAGAKVEDGVTLTVTNNVNSAQVGSYSVVYNAVAVGITTSKTRTVNIKETYNTLSTKISDLNNSITQLNTFNVKAGWNYIKPTNDARMPPTDSNIVAFYKLVPGKKPELVSSGLLEKDNIYIVECKSDGTLTLL